MVYVTQERCYWGRVFSRVELCLLFFRNAVPREAAMVQEAEDRAHCLWNYRGTARDEPNMDKSKLDTRVLQRIVMQFHHQVIYRFCKLFADIFESSTDIAVNNGIYKKEL
ncbi:unnamed protein product [Brassica rapa subsp. narinosa]